MRESPEPGDDLAMRPTGRTVETSAGLARSTTAGSAAATSAVAPQRFEHPRLPLLAGAETMEAFSSSPPALLGASQVGPCPPPDCEDSDTTLWESAMDATTAARVIGPRTAGE